MVLLATIVFGLFYALAKEQLRYFVGIAGKPLGSKDNVLRVASWNLRNFSGQESKHDLHRLKEVFETVDADVIAVQEIRDPQALRDLIPRWELHLSHKGGRGGQRLGFLYDPRTIALMGAPTEHAELSLEGRVRPAYSGYFRHLHGGPDFNLVVVHLKAMPDGFSSRRKQWETLGKIGQRLRKNSGDSDLVVLGDFNSTGPRGGSAWEEREEQRETLRPFGLRAIEVAGGCSAYWDGSRRDAWKEPSLLDQIWIGGLEESISGDKQAIPAGVCQRYGCEPFRSTRAYPEPDYEVLSDHCPLAVDLALHDDD